MLNINKLKPKWEITWGILLNFLKNNSFDVVKNKKKAAEIKTVKKSKSVDKFFNIINVNTTEIISNIKVGEKYSYNKSEIFFEKIKEKKESNYNSIVGYFKITDETGKIVQLKPEIRIYNQPRIITSEADIKTTFLEDKFLVMNLVKGDEYFNVRYQVKPFMLMIWISVLLISFGGIMSLLKKKYEK